MRRDKSHLGEWEKGVDDRIIACYGQHLPLEFCDQAVFSSGDPIGLLSTHVAGHLASLALSHIP